MSCYEHEYISSNLIHVNCVINIVNYANIYINNKKK